MTLRESPKPKAPTADELRRRRLGPDACCANCVHAYPFKSAPTAIWDELECRSPGGPMYAIVPIMDQRSQEMVGAKSTLMPRRVQPDYFCNGYEPDTTAPDKPTA